MSRKMKEGDQRVWRQEGDERVGKRAMRECDAKKEGATPNDPYNQKISASVFQTCIYTQYMDFSLVKI